MMTIHTLVCCPYVSLGQLSARVFCSVLMRFFCLVIADSQVFFIHFRHLPLLVCVLKVFFFFLVYGLLFHSKQHLLQTKSFVL